MATKQEPGFSLKLLIDEKTNRVVAAEAHKDFVDILISFLTFPMGKVIRLTSSGQVKKPVTIGCMNNLYHSIENISAENWETEHCKTMVLNPRNPLSKYCYCLRVDIDDSECDIKYYCTGACSSWFPNLSCKCGEKTTKPYPAALVYWCSGNCIDSFLQMGRSMFIISDDLQIRPANPYVLAQYLSSLGFEGIDGIREMTVQVSKEKVISLLGCSLVSESPLTDVFLPNTKCPKLEKTLSSSIGVVHTPDENAPTTLDLQLILHKSTNKLLFAMATNEFFDFLCTFLTIPVGSIIHVFRGNLRLGCMYNFYTSVEELDDKWFHSGVKSDVLNPLIAQHHNCKKQPLDLKERIESDGLIDPRSNKSFAKEHSTFIIFDNLEVKPLSSASSFLILKELNVRFDDIDEHVITVGMEEAMSLLKAALTSPSSALTNGFAPFMHSCCR